jgi:hypothetical protein
VGICSLRIVVLFDIVQLAAPDRAFLLFGAEPAPCDQVVRVLLNDDVTSTGPGSVLVADEHRRLTCGSAGVFGAVDESEKVAPVEAAEAVHLGHHPGGVAETHIDQAREFETQVANLVAITVRPWVDPLDADRQLTRTLLRAHGRDMRYQRYCDLQGTFWGRG